MSNERKVAMIVLLFLFVVFLVGLMVPVGEVWNEVKEMWNNV